MIYQRKSSKIFSTTCLAFTLAFGSLGAIPQSALAAGPANSNLTIPESEEVTLTAMRDIGLIIFQIKQQAKNIYMEATRKKVNISAEPVIEDLKFIRNADIIKTDKYLKTRPEWLTFYVGTMEPIIHLFEVNTKSKDSDGGDDKEKGKSTNFILVPRSTKAKFQEQLAVYDKGIETLNSNLTTIFDNISEENNNIVIARAAVNLYEAAERMEKAREKAFILIKKAKDKKDLVKIVRETK